MAPIGQLGEPILCKRRPRDVPAKALQLLVIPAIYKFHFLLALELPVCEQKGVF
jgi:hypothetical protein